MKIQLLSTNLKSGSLKRLAEALSVRVGYKVFRTINKRPARLQLQYGPGVDKVSQYAYFSSKGIPSVEYTTCREAAQQWVADGHVVFARHLLNSSCGKGIQVCTEEVPVAPVYTKYKPKKREFRVHIFNQKVVAIVEKKLRKGWTGPKESKIRNLANGYVFCQSFEIDEQLKGRVELLAVNASQVSSSHFCGVDVGYNEKRDEVFVIEVNSCPGIEGSNVSKYVEAICA